MNIFELFNEDCLTVMKEMNDNCIDLILTDPPYNIGQFAEERGNNLCSLRENNFISAQWDNEENEDWQELMNSFFREAARVIKDGGSMVLFASVLKLDMIIHLAETHGFYYKTVGVWHKTNPLPRNMNIHFVNSVEPWVYFIYKSKTGTFNNDNKVIHDFIETGITPRREKEHGTHPTQKPLVLMEHFIKLLSNEGDIILDPFMGSGSTAVACKNLNRNFIGVELDKNYFDIACKRVQS